MSDGWRDAQIDLRKVQASTRTLQDGLGRTDEMLVRTRNEQAQSNERVKRCEVGLERSGVTVAGLLGGYQDISVRMEAMSNDAYEMRAWLKSLQEGLDQNFSMDTSDRGATTKKLTRIQETQEKAASGLHMLQKTYEGLQTATAELRSDLVTTGSQVKNAELLIGELSAASMVMGRRLEETSARCQKTEDAHSVTKAMVSENEASTKRLLDTSERLNHGLHRTASNLESTQRSLCDAREALESQSGKLQIAEDEVQRLNVGHQSTDNLLRAVQVRLEKTHLVAETVKQDLNKTNSIVLPSITMDTMAAIAMGFPIDATAETQGQVPANVLCPTRPRTSPRSHGRIRPGTIGGVAGSAPREFGGPSAQRQQQQQHRSVGNGVPDGFWSARAGTAPPASRAARSETTA